MTSASIVSYERFLCLRELALPVGSFLMENLGGASANIGGLLRTSSAQ